jgi:hypothetical protein
VKIGIFIDEDQDRSKVIKEIKKQFSIFNPTYVEDMCISEKLLDESGFDLVVIDYGGLTTIPGNSLGEHYARYVNEYAANHPSTLIVYITVMGAQYLATEGLNMDDLHNIQWCDRQDLFKLCKEKGVFTEFSNKRKLK